jgi:hypothetical protein
VPDRFKPGGRFYYGSRKEMISELRAAGVTRCQDGPVESRKIQGSLSGMVERVRQLAGFRSAKWRSAGGRRSDGKVCCRICGGKIGPWESYCTGGGSRAHATCVSRWKAEDGGE